MASTELRPDAEREKVKEQRRANALLEEARTPVIVVGLAFVVYWIFVSIVRAPVPFSFIGAFLTAVVTTIISVAIYLIVLIRKNV